MIETILVIGFIALIAYEFGKNKPKRDADKEQIAKYNREWQEWRVKNHAVQDEHGKWHATTKRDQNGTT